jgi:hypothetical protein
MAKENSKRLPPHWCGIHEGLVLDSRCARWRPDVLRHWFDGDGYSHSDHEAYWQACQAELRNADLEV